MSRGCRPVLWLLAWAVVGGCSNLPQLASRGDVARGSGAEELFDQGLAELSSGAPASAFLHLREAYPDSPWTGRAEAVVQAVEGAVAGCRERTARRAEEGEIQLRMEAGQLARDRENCGEEVVQLSAEVDRCRGMATRLVEDWAQCTEESARLAAELKRLAVETRRLGQDNASLREDLDKLKKLTIEMELRRR